MSSSRLDLISRVRNGNPVKQGTGLKRAFHTEAGRLKHEVFFWVVDIRA